MGRCVDGKEARGRFWSKTRLHDVLGIKKGTYLPNYGKVFGAFFVAYALHGYGSDMAGGSHVGDWNYFMSQALAIWVEETVLKLATILRIRPILGDGLARAVGYLWTGAFTLYSFMIWA